MLYFAFRSVRESLLIYSTIPLSAIGGIFALAIRGMPFSISAGIGFIALFGVAVLNGIVLIAEFNRLKKEEKYSTRDIILHGTRLRLRPVLMTASVASLGFLPMALSNGSGAEVQRPLATVVIGGLVVATFLTLFVLPSLFLLFEKKALDKLSNMKALMISIPLLLLAMSPAKARQIISLQSAMDTAVKNNLLLRNEKLLASYREAMAKSGTDIPQTMVLGDYGQINSSYNDTRFSLSQTIKFPTIYARQRSLLTDEWKASQLNVAVKQNDLKKQVAGVFYQLLYIKQKQQLLLHIDSLYAGFLEKAELRFSKGESNIVEKTAASTQRGQVSQQLKNARQDWTILQARFKLLLNTDTNFEPDTSQYKTVLPQPMADSNSVQANPYLVFLAQQQQVSNSEYKVEKSKLLPDLVVAYNNMSIKGVGADEKYYSSSRRFQSAQIGVGIPIFASSQKARINASKVKQGIAQNNLEAGRQLLQGQYNEAWLQYQKAADAVHYYESLAIPNANVLLATSLLQYQKGEINYLEWTYLTNQAISIQSEYIDAVNTLQHSVIEINAITGKL
jgi:cobalt-zinc-cadmium resistance protein CzcA